jgi:hypothetical protein
MKFIAISILMVMSFASWAQNLTGIVCTEKDKAPAPFATVGLRQLPDSSLITGVITLSDGGYLFEKVKPGNYILDVSFLGYKADKKSVTIPTGNGEVKVDTIYLVENATTLKEAVVVSERLKGKELVDRTVYAVPSAIAKTSTNGYEILKKIPQVNVDFQNNITMNGSTNFIIQVDGRQRDKEFLAKLLPSDIESVEVISNPSGKYEGNIDGVINIILKKEARYGMNGNAGLNIKPFNKPTISGSGSLDYALGKITFYVTGFSFLQMLKINQNNESYFKTADSTINMHGEGNINVSSSSVNSGFDYYMNDKNNLSFNVSYKPTHQDIDIPGLTTLLKTNIPLNTMTSSTNNITKSDETNMSLFYKKTFSHAIQEFTAEGTYYFFNSKEDNDYLNNRYLYNTNSELSSYSRLENNVNKRNYLSMKLNYIQPIGLSAKIELGYQLYYQKMSYDFQINNVESKNLFVYDELRNSAYTGITFNMKKIGFQAMLRVENTNISADSITEPRYTCFLPSVNFQYKFSASQNLKFTYNRRINRPGIYDMDPYWKIGQNYDITTGNPDLKPDYRDRLQLTYTLNMGSNYLSPSVYYEFLSNKVGRRFQVVQSPVNGAITTFTKPYNLLSGYEYGGGLNAMLWFVNINGRIFKGHFEEYREQLFTIPSRDYFSYTITSYAFAPLDKAKKTNAYIFLSYTGVNIDAQSKTYSMPLWGLGAQKQIKDHSLGIFFLLPFYTNVKFRRVETDTPYFLNKNDIGFNVSNFIQFSYSYKFNKGKNVKKLDHKVEVESDSKSQGIGK